MSLLRPGSPFKHSVSCVLRLLVAATLILSFDATAAAQSPAGPLPLPVVQVTADPADDTLPALVETARGELLIVFVRSGALWSRASPDDGATWAAEAQIDGCCRYHPSLARRPDGTLWLVYDRDGDIWRRISTDHGVTWAAEQRLTSDPAGERTDDYDPVVFQAFDGVVWIVWQGSHPFYNQSSIWYKSSTDGGDTWSADIPLTRDYRDTAPAITQAAGGRLVVVWNRHNWLHESSSTDGGVTWSDPVFVTDVDRNRPSLAAVDTLLWLVYEHGRDILYRTSADAGQTWSDEAPFTHFVGDDSAPAAIARAPGGVAIAWHSDRSGNPDIWFGSSAGRQDLNPPPYVLSVDHTPWPNPESDDTIALRAIAQDETAVSGVTLEWALDGIAQKDLSMFDDGVHGDGTAGDGLWGVQVGPLPEGSQITYRAGATDVDGNHYRYPAQNSLKVLPEFVTTAAILFVADAGGNNTPSDTAWFRPYYTRALEARGYRYDTWDTGYRGPPGSAILGRYTAGAVIWAVPYSGYATDSRFESVHHLQAYLDAGGKLFITGPNVAQFLLHWYGEDFLRNYLHATLRQEDSGLYALAGAAGDPIGGGLALNISGGDGANNQYSKDEIDPIAPAEVVFTYRASVNTMLAEPVRPVEAAAAPAGNTGSGTAALRVDTGAYKVVYFAFGFEAIDNAGDRAAVMERVLAWLEAPRFRGAFLPLVYAGPPSIVDQFWAERYYLHPGECTNIHWFVVNAQEIYLDGVAVTGIGTRRVCPASTSVYTLTVVRVGGTVQRTLVIVVDDDAVHH